MGKERVTLNDTGISSMIKLAEGNPGALTTLMKIMQEGEKIDPDNFMGSMGTILMFDTFGIYGSRIWMLYKDVCGQSLTHTIAVLRACQMGLITSAVMNHAIDNYGKGLDIYNVLKTLQIELPNFGKGE
jgi:hypothetical protein